MNEQNEKNEQIPGQLSVEELKTVKNPTSELTAEKQTAPKTVATVPAPAPKAVEEKPTEPVVPAPAPEEKNQTSDLTTGEQTTPKTVATIPAPAPKAVEEKPTEPIVPAPAPVEKNPTSELTAEKQTAPKTVATVPAPAPKAEEQAAPKAPAQIAATPIRDPFIKRVEAWYAKHKQKCIEVQQRRKAQKEARKMLAEDMAKQAIVCTPSKVQTEEGEERKPPKKKQREALLRKYDLKDKEFQSVIEEARALIVPRLGVKHAKEVVAIIDLLEHGDI